VLPTTGEQPPDEEPLTARAETEPWIRTPIEDRYAAGMRVARDFRRARAAAAAGHAIAQARELADEAADFIPEITPGAAWELRGEQRTRETFAQPHPADFPGGLDLPREYPG
jgi:hypothetical protein